MTAKYHTCFVGETSFCVIKYCEEFRLRLHEINVPAVVLLLRDQLRERQFTVMPKGSKTVRRRQQIGAR